LARLARKIDSAKQAGDEIVMPEWEDADDRAMAEAYVDLFAAVIRMKQSSSQGYSGGIDESAPIILPMLRCFDADVPVGAAVLKHAYSGAKVLTDVQELELVKPLTRLMSHSDPLVRGAAVVLAAADWRHLSVAIIDETRLRRRELERLGPIDELLWKAARDDAPEVRAAAAIACPRYGVVRFPSDMQQLLRKDTNAAVRVLAYLRTRFYGEHPPTAADLRPGLRDANPIVRTYCLKRIAELLFDDYAMSWASVPGREARLVRRFAKQREALRATMKAQGADADPWLNLAAEAFAAQPCGRSRPNAAPDGQQRPIPPDAVQMQEHANAVLAGLLASGKRSHTMLACSVLRSHSRTAGAPRRPRSPGTCSASRSQPGECRTSCGKSSRRAASGGARMTANGTWRSSRRPCSSRTMPIRRSTSSAREGPFG